MDKELEIETSVPNPGTKRALDMGCKCPILDNEHGRGWMGMPGVFVYNESCPVHPVLQSEEGGSDE